MNTNKKYFLYKVQAGEGCDYSIGCGQKLSELESTCMNDAIEEVLDLQYDWRSLSLDELEELVSHGESIWTMDEGQEQALYSCEILEVTDQVNLEPILNAKLQEYNALVNYKRSKGSEEKERELYEKLKKKFDK